MQHCNYAKTPSETDMKLENNESEKEVDATYFRNIVVSLRYLCNTRPNITF
jgi:hypothetical protein